MPGRGTTPAACARCGRATDAELRHCAWCGTLRRSKACGRHPFHVARWACVVCGIPLCHRCQVGGRHAGLCRRHAGVRLVQGWAEVARAPHEAEAEVLAGALRAAGLTAQVLSQKDHANVVTFGGLAVVRILVPACEYRAAVAAVAGREGGSGRGAVG